MPIEHAAVQVVHKPWGVNDLHPWSLTDGSGDAVGELLFQRADKTAPPAALLLKLLFTSEPLSIQVHPDDAFAHSIGLPNGKTEAWYILSAKPGAQVAVGLKRNLTPQELRAAIRDGSIAGLVDWRSTTKGDIIVVPAGTIHAIGAGIVLAEIQQHSDATFRLFDYGRPRELHEDNAVAASCAGPLQAQSGPRRLTAARTALAAIPHFVIERIDLPANSNWILNADRETWVLVIEGDARIDMASTSVGDAMFVEGDRAGIEAGADGMSALIAYPGPDPIMSLLQESGEQMTSSADTSTLRSLPKPKEIVEAQT
ncbi:class I mannose-6-phosphate isomerase [Bradyrhizobium sediminis]|uniref:Class I mannose-6-phosphate isomerase n=1 Tax=Bradyrhizobium sediminis TaxID=2840469 RepID=A0A975RPE0_9BRAD|nr:class I mannose-6-phosphate isomerase [Bradyrhizobium sediminis]QWG14506.1 class I mannose-6-phosphate isomerase [Bradyrhizobium sediminis]